MQQIANQLIFGLEYWTNLLEKHLDEYHPDFLHDLANNPVRQNRLRERIKATTAQFDQQVKDQIPLDVNLEQCTANLLTDFDYPVYIKVRDFLQKYHPNLYLQYNKVGTLRSELVDVCQEIRKKVGENNLSDMTVTQSLIDQHFLYRPL